MMGNCGGDYLRIKEDVVGKALGFDTRCYDHTQKKWVEIGPLKPLTIEDLLPKNN